MNWSQFAKAAPDLAKAGEERFERWSLILLGSVRKDGTPRISPVEPLIVGGELLLGMMWQSKKALDLLREPRCLVHSIITDRKGNEGEFKLRGRARDIADPGTSSPSRSSTRRSSPSRVSRSPCRPGPDHRSRLAGLLRRLGRGLRLDLGRDLDAAAGHLCDRLRGVDGAVPTLFDEVA